MFSHEPYCSVWFTHEDDVCLRHASLLVATQTTELFAEAGLLTFFQKIVTYILCEANTHVCIEICVFL